MDELDNLNMAVDALKTKVRESDELDLEAVQKMMSEIRNAIEALAGLMGELAQRQARAYLRQAIGGTWNLKSLEKQYIRSVVEECAGNQAQAIEWLGIARTTLWRKLKDGS